MPVGDLVAHGVLLGVFVVAGGALLLASAVSTEEVMDEARAQWRDAYIEADSDVALQDLTHNITVQNVVFIVKNVGKHAIHPERVSLLLDGEPVAFAYTIEGNPLTKLWLPGENATFIGLDLVALAPGFAAMTLENGRTVPFHLDPVPWAIEVSPSNATIILGLAESFSATVRDQYGDAMQGVSVSWSTDAGTIDATGLLTAGHVLGTDFWVTASVDGREGTASVAVISL